MGPVPKEMVRAVSSAIKVPYIVAGGVTTTLDLRLAYSNGADIVQIGTAFENADNAYKRALAFSKIVKEEGRKKIKG